MFRRDRAFTLAELLTVLAIIVVMAGLLFPVFVSAKNAAKKAQCMSNMRQAQVATEMYMSDYDGTFMPVNHRPGAPPNSRLDRTWVQLILPYARSFGIFTCPADTSVRDIPEPTFDQDLVPGDMDAQYYRASMRVDMGYNYLNLAPIVWQRNRWVSLPKMQTELADPSKTILFIDSIWDRTRDGRPVGGGNWVVVPPCRYQGQGIHRFDTIGMGDPLFTPWPGWKITDPNSPHRYGNAWPWHSGQANVARADGSVKSMAIAKLSVGCDVRDNWQGTIRDPDQYMWGTE